MCTPRTIIGSLILLLLFGCDSRLKDNLWVALSSDKSKKEIIHLVQTRTLKAKLSKDNFLYFFLTTAQEKYKGYDFEFTPEALGPINQAKTVARKVKAEGTVVITDDVEDLSYSKFSDKYTKGSLSVHNEIFNAKIIFLEDIQSNEIIKMCIPLKGKGDFEDSLVIFDKSAPKASEETSE